MSYTFSNQVVDHAQRAFASGSFVFESNVLAALADDRATLELWASEIREDAAIRQFFIEESNCDISISDISLLDFLECSDVDAKSFSYCGNSVRAFYQAKFYQGSTPSTIPGSVLAPSYEPLRMQSLGACLNCLHQGQVVSQRAVWYGTSYSALCALCCDESGVEDVFAGLSTAFVYLSKIEPIKLLSCAELLLRLVIAAIVYVAYLLKARTLCKGIVTSQRAFFTNHGTHPPRVQSQKSGLLCGKGFQPRFAA